MGTWLILDSRKVASYYPSTGYRSSDHPNVHKVYWRCVACFFATAFRMLGSKYRLVFYTTVDAVPDAISAILDACGVVVQHVEMEHLPPQGYFGAWRNQFYILDIIRHIARFDPSDALILDSDCVFVGDVEPLFDALKEEGVLTYDLESPPDENINGLSREQMKILFGELLGNSLREPPAYLGGEFFAGTAREIARIDAEIDPLWSECLLRAIDRRAKLNEEAHFLSYLYFKLGYRNGTANPFIRRIWTQLRGREVFPDDYSLPIWHLPAEKRYGMLDLFSCAGKRDSWFWELPVNGLWKSRVGAILGVPDASIRKKSKDLCRAIKYKALVTIAEIERKGRRD
ncbi:MAG: hypothetical protein ABSE46_11450 [Terracidiphilus sp.]